MKTISERLVSVIVGLVAAVVCMTAPAVNAVQPEPRKGASKMLFEVQNAEASANSDVKVNIVVRNVVALNKIDDLGLVVDGDITPKSIALNTGGNCTYSVSGNKITFSLSGLQTPGNGSAMLTVTYHVNNCAEGYYKVDWSNAGFLGALGYLKDGSAYQPMFDYGYIHVTQGAAQPATSTTTTKVTTTTTTTTTTSSSTSTTTTTTSRPVTTTTTTKPNTDPNPSKYALGDVNNDGTVDGSDATWVLREFGNVLGGFGESFTPEQFLAGDVDKNGVIDGSDATLILKFFGEAGKDVSISYGGMEPWMQKNFWNK